jgi:hypothetical protein
LVDKNHQWHGRAHRQNDTVLDREVVLAEPGQHKQRDDIGEELAGLLPKQTPV